MNFRSNLELVATMAGLVVAAVLAALIAPIAMPLIVLDYLRQDA